MDLSKKVQAILLLIVGLSLLGIGGRGIYKYVRWKRFAVVHEGRVYRSGQLEEHKFRKAIEQLKLKTVICLNPDVVDWEKAICEEKGVRFVCYPMHSSGLGKPEYFAEIVELMASESAQPVLVHCRAGVARTGASIALLRMAKEGWSFDQAIEELRSFERKGRCEPALQKHIQQIYATHFTSAAKQVASQPSVIR